MKSLGNLSDRHKGILLVIAGTILLLNTLDIFKTWLNTFLIIGSLAMIAYGIYYLREDERIKKYYQKILKSFNKKKTAKK